MRKKKKKSYPHFTVVLSPETVRVEREIIHTLAELHGYSSGSGFIRSLIRKAALKAELIAPENRDCFSEMFWGGQSND